MGAAVRVAIEWAEQHPDEVRAIVQRATAFAKRFLNRGAIDCYLLQVCGMLQVLPLKLVQRHACDPARHCPTRQHSAACSACKETPIVLHWPMRKNSALQHG